ncbi:hypothetical protein E2562_008817 [Oryza meyeriana var. granulata]|uniref:Xylanase inhibitor N-terminal domain-containing protein n=1 Tax=Oryza meyeriana var. granulata TaxID=110450 RepID=A0A6G1D065_9ORYZ|nr:hypothetical protein E2562_008817 [Oryza meyeriana var. granulata]
MVRSRRRWGAVWIAVAGRTPYAAGDALCQPGAAALRPPLLRGRHPRRGPHRPPRQQERPLLPAPVVVSPPRSPQASTRARPSPGCSARAARRGVRPARVRHLTYAAVQCGELPTAKNPPACSGSNVYIYQASYGDSSYSVGKDTVSFGSGSFPDLYYGCGQDNEGLIGLAKHKLSLLYQLAPSLGYAFSYYCLPTSSAAAAG